MRSRSNGTTHFPSPNFFFLPLLAFALFLNPISVLAAGFDSSTADAGAISTCGNGVVEALEQCDSGSAVGAPDCDTLCRQIEFEPEGLPFGVRPIESGEAGLDAQPRIYSPRLDCANSEEREGARLSAPVRVKYRIHLCRTEDGDDAYTPEQVRNVMAASAEEFADSGIVLEEESLVRFTEDDCDMPFDEPDWDDGIRQDTPAGVLSVAFVAGITSTVNQFSIGGFCYFGGPLCVNAGAFPSLVVHELGHFLGLAHTFECAYGRETEDTCSVSGDHLCDTPPDRGPKGVRGIAACDDGTMLSGSCSGACGAKVCTDGSRPDSYDWMSYYHCEPGHFTVEQRDFMRCMLDHEMIAYNADPISSTTTTLPATICGDVTGDGDLTASDALGVLRAGVGLTDCAPWVCDYNGSGALSASDALAVLKAAVGQGAVSDCPVEPA